MATDSEIVGGELENELANFEFSKFANQVKKGWYLEPTPENISDNQEKIDFNNKTTKLNSFKEMSENIEFIYEKRKKEEMLKMSNC